MTDKPLERVRRFHKTFRIQSATSPTIPDKKTQQLRIDLIQEELDELKDAFAQNDIVAVADALGDLSVVIDGTYETCGLSEYKDAISEEIFQSNMSKADENGAPLLREDGKVLKSDRYFAPNIARILGKTCKDED